MNKIKLGLLTVYYTDTRAYMFSLYGPYKTVSTDGSIKAIDLLVDVLFTRRDVDSLWPQPERRLTLEAYNNCLEDTQPIDITIIRKAA